ncbi:hypothetical protein N2152v2_002727 [Parachlorella kessleri]
MRYAMSHRGFRRQKAFGYTYRVLEGRLQQLSGATQPSGEQPLSADSPAAAVERQNERGLAYSLLTVVLGTLGLFFVALPQHVVEFAFVAAATAVPVGLLRLVGGTFLLAAVASNCLKEAADHGRLKSDPYQRLNPYRISKPEAADHGRLKSDTYQRLNLGLFWWAAGSLAVVWLAGRGLEVRAAANWTFTVLMAFAALVPALTYHATSPEGLSPPFLLARLLESAGATWDPHAGASATAYGLATLLTGFGAVAILVGKLPVLQAPKLAAPLGALGGLLLKLQGVGMLLACVVHFTLKDAAARGRLGASTFKSLNAGIALVCLNNLLVLSSWLRGGLVELHGLRSPVVTASAALLGVSLWNYFTAKKK